MSETTFVQFTRDDVAFLRGSHVHEVGCSYVDALSDYCMGCNCTGPMRAEELATRIEALLPRSPDHEGATRR